MPKMLPEVALFLSGQNRQSEMRKRYLLETIFLLRFNNSNSMQKINNT